MKSRLAAAAALVAVAVSPALAQNTANVTGSQIPLSNNGLNIGTPESSDATTAWTGTPAGSASGASMSGSSASGASSTAGSESTTSTTSGAMSSSSGSSAAASTALGAPPSSYPVCRTRSQDRCRVAGSR